MPRLDAGNGFPGRKRMDGKRHVDLLPPPLPTTPPSRRALEPKGGGRRSSCGGGAELGEDAGSGSRPEREREGGWTSWSHPPELPPRHHHAAPPPRLRASSQAAAGRLLPAAAACCPRPAQRRSAERANARTRENHDRQNGDPDPYSSSP
ncbi:hypothetical protein PVAP13_5NG361824 [Panicum virgatum]|uniref:Uncharacterized protein n=1 Tax=Panicum virgatum TaxID=38727 RepID=A0A8T0RXJ0_PANVG|nr:hypothetical protein PVAP13_5NG361824 [Panicum virgatum]